MSLIEATGASGGIQCVFLLQVSPTDCSDDRRASEVIGLHQNLGLSTVNLAHDHGRAVRTWDEACNKFGGLHLKGEKRQRYDGEDPHCCLPRSAVASVRVT